MSDELTGVELDLAVARCQGLPLRKDPMGFAGESPESAVSGWWVWDDRAGYPRSRMERVGGSYSPSTRWEQGGPIIESENILVRPPTIRRLGIEKHTFPVTSWRAMYQRDENEEAIHGWGPTPLIAAMRCYVKVKGYAR